MVTIANGFSRQGKSVVLVLANAKGPYLEDVESSVRIVDFRSKRVSRCTFKLAAWIREYRPACVLSALTHANIVAIVAGAMAGRLGDIVVSQRGVLSDSMADKPSIRNMLVGILTRLIYPRARNIISVSDAVSRDLNSRFNVPLDKLVTVPNPISIERVLAKSNERNPAAASLASESRLVLTAGRLHAVKDQATLIRAFARVRAFTDVHLVILGDGPLRESLEALAVSLNVAEFVTFIGFSQNPYSWMKVADVFVLSSRHEGLPNVLIEAMVCGAKIVATDSPGGTSDILEGGEWGRLVPVGDDRLLAEAILASLNDIAPPNVRSRALEYSEEKVMAMYSCVLKIQ
ncbi:RfaG Glycosyltransferase [Caulobacteraceae bacterium]